MATEEVCDVCSRALGQRFFSVVRNVEFDREIGEISLETVVLESVQLSAYCTSCGVAPALQAFRDLRLTPLRSQACPPTPLCCRCQGRFVPEDQPHLVYWIEHDEWCGDGSVMPTEIFRAPVCGECWVSSSGEAQVLAAAESTRRSGFGADNNFGAVT